MMIRFVSPEGVWKYADALACGCITEDNSLAEVSADTTPFQNHREFGAPG